MGMFNYINVEIPCPKCGTTVDTFQSKDANCDLTSIDPTQVSNFYGDCPDCGYWIEMEREEQPKRRDRPFNKEEVDNLGFKLIEEDQ